MVVIWDSSSFNSFASPKSDTRASRFPSSKMLLDLMSRWITLGEQSWCKYATPLAAPTIMFKRASQSSCSGRAVKFYHVQVKQNENALYSFTLKNEIWYNNCTNKNQEVASFQTSYGHNACITPQPTNLVRTTQKKTRSYTGGSYDNYLMSTYSISLSAIKTWPARKNPKSV